MISKTRNWKFWAPLILGIFILTNETLWITLNGLDLGDADNEASADIKRVFGGFYMFAFFTTQTNLFLGLTFILIAFYQTPRAYSWFMGSTMLMMITFFAYWSLLFDVNNKVNKWNDPYFTISTLFTHGVNPFSGFIFLFIIRKQISVHKKIIGRCTLHMTFFYTFNAIFYGAATRIIDDQTGQPILDPASVYRFLEIQKLFFFDFTNQPALGVFANLLLFIVCPIFPLSCSFCWIKLAKIQTEDQSYYRWIDRLKAYFKARKLTKNSSKTSSL